MSGKILNLSDRLQGQSGGKEEERGEALFTIHNIYIKDLSFEAPHTPHLFTEEWQPKLDLDLRTESRPSEEGVFEVILRLTVSVKLNEGKVAFLIEMQQAGIFTITGMEEEMVQRILGVQCPAILFPYAREEVSSLVIKGGFPQLLLPPLDFHQMFEARLEAETRQGE